MRKEVLVVFIVFVALGLATTYHWRSDVSLGQTDVDGQPTRIPGRSTDNQIAIEAVKAPVPGDSINRTSTVPETLADEFNRLNQLARAGDRVATRELAKLIENCGLFALRPLDYEAEFRDRAATMKDSAAAKMMVALAARRAQYCRELAMPDLGSPRASQIAKEWMAKSAQMGDLQARLSVAVKSPDPMPPADFERMVDEVANSRDPDAILLMADLMGNRAPRSRHNYSDLSGNDSWTSSWSIAACRLGANCTDPRMLENICFNFGYCAAQSLEQFYVDAILSPAQRQQIERNVDLILARLRRK